MEEVLQREEGETGLKLYHFTPGHLIEQITHQGLTLGQFPFMFPDGTFKLLGPCQWLTNDANPDKQSWATKSLIDYDRTEYRLDIVIPKTSRKLLKKAYDFLPEIPKSARGIIEGWLGSENWYLFFGNIPSSWIRKIELSREGIKLCMK